MHMLFVDESGNLPPKAKVTPGEKFVLGGLVIPEDQWHTLSGEFRAIKNRHRVKGEIKWRYFSQSREGTLSHLTQEEKDRLRDDIFSSITRYKAIQIIAVVVSSDTFYTKANINNQNDLYWNAYETLTQRFQYHLQDLGRTVGSKINGIVVCDHRGNKDDALIRDLHHSKLSNRSTHKNLIEGVFLSPSHQSVGIQLADMIAGAIFRNFSKGDDRFYNQILGSIRNNRGNVNGYGIINLS